MVQQIEHAICFSLTLKCSDSFGKGLPQSQQRRVSIEMILAVIRITKLFRCVRLRLGSSALIDQHPDRNVIDQRP